MIRLDAATVLVQLAAGGWFFLWAATRRGQIGAGYGWLLRGLGLGLAAGSLAVGLAAEPVWAREAATAVMLVGGLVALVASAARRASGGLRPGVDLAVAGVGLVAMVAGASAAGGPLALAAARTVAGALFLGAVTGAMLLGHWYLVQPSLPRRLIGELVAAAGALWLVEAAAMVWPTGMFSVLSGAIDDGYNGLLGWFWAACTIATAGLVAAAAAALRERGYQAVMAVTGLMYLAVITAFGQDLVARILLAP